MISKSTCCEPSSPSRRLATLSSSEKDAALARRFQKMGYLIHPDPSDPAVAEAHAQGRGPVFEKIGKLPLWNPEGLIRRVAKLRDLGAEQVCFKTGPFAPKDLRLILEIASEAGVDLVTFDGAGGGTGHSPVKMMNEWGIPTVQLEQLVFELARKLHHLGRPLPQIAIAGGFATEDQVFKGLALGAPYIGLVALGRAAMTAAMVGQRVGEALQAGEDLRSEVRDVLPRAPGAGAVQPADRRAELVAGRGERMRGALVRFAAIARRPARPGGRASRWLR